MHTRAAPSVNITWLQWLLWPLLRPLIAARLLALKLRIRAQYGRGVPFQYFVTPWGEVHFLRFRADPAGMAPSLRLLGDAGWPQPEPLAHRPARLAALFELPAAPAPPRPCAVLRPRIISWPAAVQLAPDTS
ncbi:MAG: hypothetical protein ACK46Q_14440 [Hyphomonas sp.]